MKTLKNIVVVTLTLGLHGATNATADTAITSKVPILRGNVSGIGGAPQTWPEFMTVCREAQIKKAFPKALIAALNGISVSIKTDEPPIDAIRENTKIETNAVVLNKKYLEQYNSVVSNEFKINTRYNYGIQYAMLCRLDEAEIYFQSTPRLLIGGTIDSLVQYNRAYDSRQFHNILLMRIEEAIRKLECR